MISADAPTDVQYAPQRGDGEFNILRPQRFADFSGQRALLDNLNVMLQAAKLRGEALEHVLLSGPPGLGKTTLAHLIAAELETLLVVSSGPLLERTGDLVAILSSLNDGQVLFIDEIHRLPRPVEEVLYSAMEDYKVDIVTGVGPGARTITLPLARFTLVGATTRSGMLSAPLRDRFGGLFHLEFYTPDELAQIIGRAEGLLHIALTPEARLISPATAGARRVSHCACCAASATSRRSQARLK